VAVSRDGSSFAVRRTDGRTRVAVFRRGVSGWEADGVLDHGAWTPDFDPYFIESHFGEAVSMSADGKFLAVGDWGDTGQGNGVLYPPIAASGPQDGAVYLFERKTSGWKLRQFIRPNTDTARMFGWSISLGDNGRSLAVGAPQPGSVWLY
jgi:WD40 repeat protein